MLRSHIHMTPLCMGAVAVTVRPTGCPTSTRLRLRHHFHNGTRVPGSLDVDSPASPTAGVPK